MVLLQRMVRPCGDGVSDIYIDPQDPGCLPYSAVTYSNDLNDKTCPDGDTLGIESCCGDDISCAATKTDNCNPCTSIMENVPLDNTKWKDDICYYYCPPYWTQRQYLQETGYFPTDEQLCSERYKNLCELVGCETDPACKIRWGGCEYTNIDMDICNGGQWDKEFLNDHYQPDHRCEDTPPSQYCISKGLCQIGRYYPRCRGYPWDTPEILPTVVKKSG